MKYVRLVASPGKPDFFAASPGKPDFLVTLTIDEFSCTRRQDEFPALEVLDTSDEE